MTNGEPEPRLGPPVYAETATLRQYVDDITTLEGLGQASARTCGAGKTQLTQ